MAGTGYLVAHEVAAVSNPLILLLVTLASSPDAHGVSMYLHFTISNARIMIRV